MHGWLGVERAPWIRDFWMLDVRENLWVSFAFSDHFPSARFAFSMSLVDFRQSSFQSLNVWALVWALEGLHLSPRP
eukprot:5526653-Pyramimonas_sp.AAC.1